MNIPSISSTRNMAPRMTIGATSKPVAQLTIPLLAPEIARSWLNTVEFIRMKNTMPAVRSVPISEVPNAFQVKRRKMTARSTTPITPKEADSDGVAQPSTMKPITMNTTSPMGRMLTTIS